MVRRFSWCTVVALVVLLFVTTEGLRERNTQDEDSKTPSTTNRGTLRFNSKSLDEPATVSTVSRTRLSRDRPSNFERRNERTTLNPFSTIERRIDSDDAKTTESSILSTTPDTTNYSRNEAKESKKVGPASSRRNGKAYSPGNNERTKSTEPTIAPETIKEISRKPSSRKFNNSGVSKKLDNRGPSVFTATTEYSRSRTGRKIQTTYSSTHLKSQIPSARRYTSKRFEDVEATTSAIKRMENRTRTTTEKPDRRNRTGRLKGNQKENNTRGRDSVLSESESVRVDIPLIAEATEQPVTDSTTPVAASSDKQETGRRSDTRSNSRTGSERSKGRGRSSDPESATSASRNGSRRGVSRYTDSTTTDANEAVSLRRNTVSRDRSRSSDAKKNSATESRPRSRGRNGESSFKTAGTSDRDVRRKSTGERNSPDRKSRILEAGSRAIDNRAQDQDSRGRSRSRSRLDTTTVVVPDVTTTVAPETMVSSDITTTSTEPQVTVTTIKQITQSTTPINSRIATTTTRPSTTSTAPSEGSGRSRGNGRRGNQSRKLAKEDFFNHGLGFRGRKFPPEGSSNGGDSRKSNAKNETYHGNPGWTLRRRPGHSNYSETLPKAIVPSPTDQTNEVIPSNEQSTSTEIVSTVESVTRRGFKKPQTTEESTTVDGTTAKSTRRGNKTFEKNRTFGSGKVSTEPSESDNYPPEFKARLSQLKNTNTKVSASKTTPRTPLEDELKNIFGRRSRTNSKAFEPDDLETAASGNVFLTEQSLDMNPLMLINGTGKRRVKKSSAALFAERSRMKLDLARRLVKPELNIEENDLDATTASSFSKPKATVVPVQVDGTSKVVKFAKPIAAGRRGSAENSQGDDVSKGSKLSRLRKGLEDSSSKVTGRPSSLKKGRVVSERMVTSISVEERLNTEDTTKPYVSTTPSVVTVVGDEGSATTIDSTKIRLPGSRAGKRIKEEEPSTNTVKSSVNPTRRIVNNDSITTYRPKKPYAHPPRNGKIRELFPTTEPSFTTTPKPRKSFTSSQSEEQSKEIEKSQEESVIKKPKFSNLGKSTFRPRYGNRSKQQKSIEDKSEYQTTAPTVTTKQPAATSRYSKKKSAVKTFDSKRKATTTEGGIVAQTKKQEFRPRTSTYRRHSEIPTSQVESSTKVDGAGVAITPRATRYHATLKSSTTTTRSVPQVPQVNLQIANDSTQQAPGIIGSSNGDSGNTNIFSPTRSSVIVGNATLLEQLRSTVAPLLSSLGNKTPVFSGSYSNVNNANSAPRITPNGSPPRFSARYKGAELFIRKQNNVYQPTVPSITSSSTTPSTPVENSGSAPPIDVSNPGEPRFLTFYQALESASIRNEQLQGNSSAQREEQVGRVPQVDSNTTVANGISNNSNSDTTSPTVATTSPQTPDTIANTIQDRTENSTPAVTTGAPENPSTTEQASTSIEPPSTTEQASTSVEPSSTTVQATTATETSSTTEQISTSTESLSSTEQSSTNADPTTTPVQTTTEPLPGNPDVTTSSGDSQDVQIFQRVDSALNSIVETTTAPPNQDLTSSLAPTTVATTDGAISTVANNEMQTTDNTLATSTQNPETTSMPQTVTPDTTATPRTQTSSSVDTTTAATVTSDAPTTTSENPESNTIQQSDTIVTQAADVRTTEVPTTEAVSNNMIDVETTTETPTPTVRNRLIDFAQDILSHLQTIITSTESDQDLTTTVSPETEISNVISDSGTNNTLEVLARFNEVNASTPGELGTTTLSSVTTDQPGVRTTPEITTRNAVDSVTTSLPTTTQEASTQDEVNFIATTTPAQESQTVSNVDTTTLGDLASTSSPPPNTEITTMSMTTSTDDTLLTELMSIAKTLLSEEMNETEQFAPPQNSSNTSQLENLMENDVDQSSLSNDALGTTQATESSSILPDVTTETVESTPTAVSMPELTTLPIDSSQNEVDSIEPTTTGSPSESSSDTPATTLENNVVSNEVDAEQTTQTTPLGPPTGTVESTTPSFQPENETQVTISSRISSDLETGLDTTTQSQTTTQNSETTVMPSLNFELTTNTFDLVSSSLVTTTETQTPSGQTTEMITEPTETATTNFTIVTSQPTMVTSTNPPETMMSTIPESTTPPPVNTTTIEPLTSPELNAEQTTVEPTTEFVQSVTNGVDNGTTESVSQLTSLTTDTVSNEILEATTPTITTMVSLVSNSMDAAEATTNQPPLTSTTDPSPAITTNMPGDTTNTAQTTPNLENETPTVIARFQDATSATAQGTADSGIGQTTPMITESSTSPSPDPPTSSTSSIMTTISSMAETATPTTTTMTTETTTERLPNGGTSTPQATTQSAGMNVVTVTPVSETTVSTPVTTVDINENLVSTEAPAENVNFTSRIGVEENVTATAETTTQTPTQMTSGMTMPPAPTSSASPMTQTPTTPYIGRFGGSRMTPAPRFSISSTTRAPLRDYLVYGIYPNKTIVRKRPEDNLIDARNVNSPYVIFGIFPDGKLVRKFPNGTIIPDPPRSPVEVVFSLSTSTTTNRPPPRPFYNQANQDTYNQYQAPVYNNNRRPDAELMRNVENSNTVDLGLTGNAIVGPNGGGPDFTGPLGTPASAPSTGKMSNVLLNTQMGTTPSVMSAIAGLLTPMVSTGRPPTDSQGGRIVQDRERDEATRTKEAGGQRSSVYIGQDKFVNYWTDGVSTTNPRVESVKINSVATAANAGFSSSIPSFENLLNNQPAGQATAPPGFPWRDPLDQIFGVTTSPPVITASISSNMLDDPETSAPLLPRPINPFVEVFTPFSSTFGIARSNTAAATPTPTTTTTMSTTTTTTTTMAPTTTTTTTMAPTTTTTTTMAPTTTTTTTMAPTTTTTTTMAPTTTTTTTMAPTTTTIAPTTTSVPARTATAANFVSQTTGTVPETTSAPANIPLSLPNDLLARVQQQSAFGRTFDDLAFLNSLLQSNTQSTTPKTLTQVEQLLANKILSLALNDAGPTRAPKAINIGNTFSNSLQSGAKSSDPIVIDLSPSSTTASTTWKLAEQNSQNPVKSSPAPDQVTWKPVSTSTKRDVEPTVASSSTAKTTLISTTKIPITTTPQPRTTTARSFGSTLWEAIFGNGLFAPPPTAKPVKPKQAKTAPKSVSITPKPIPTTQTPQTTVDIPSATTLRTVDVSKIQVNTPNSFGIEKKSVTTSKPVSTTKQPLLNNPNPRLPAAATSTFSPEDDAKFLISLLRAAQEVDNNAGASRKSGLNRDDELFLRAILSGQALATTTPAAPLSEISNAALLATLLKAQGIEPPTPATNIREQLQSASLGQSVTSAPTASPTSESTTITTRPPSTATRPTDATKKTVTQGPRIRTTTWSPSSTYPPPLFGSFANYGTSPSGRSENSENGVLFGATRAFSRFLGTALSGAAQQLQSLVRNGTRLVSDVVG